MDLRANDPRSPEVLAKSRNRNEQSIFFYVSPVKLVVMSVVTFGFYEIFWFYKNWFYVKEHSQTKCWPLVRSIFSTITYYFLLQEIQKAGEVQGIKPSFALGVPAIAFFALTACWRLPDPFGLVGIFAPFALLPAQKYINSLNTVTPTEINDKFSVANWVAIVIGGFLTLICMLGFFLPSPK
jgi:hypothetical protein